VSAASERFVDAAIATSLIKRIIASSLADIFFLYSLKYQSYRLNVIKQPNHATS
jgi:hypothetical protein